MQVSGFVVWYAILDAPELYACVDYFEHGFRFLMSPYWNTEFKNCNEEMSAHQMDLLNIVRCPVFWSFRCTVCSRCVSNYNLYISNGYK